MRIVVFFVGLMVCAPLVSAETISFNRDIKPILSNNCFECHGPDARARKRRPRLDTFEGATSITRFEKYPVVPGKPAESEVINRITSENPEYRMPPADTGKTLSAAEIALISEWIAQGGEYEEHWSYIAPQRPELPEVSDPEWVSSPVDAFILSKLDAEELTPSPEADRYTLARRVAFDITGLPPTPGQLERFASARDVDKGYARLVDELLESPAYGEHWARLWLDLARYADSKGYEADRTRTIWKYRDWVIQALNSDMPYTQFTAEQLAGDLMPEPTEDQIVATAFHRNTMNNDEGGTDDEEFRTAAVMDRVDTTMQVWMGTTMNCAQCHDHKYDPISTKEYYKFFAFFNQTADADRNDESPTYWHATDEEKAQKSELEAARDAAKKELERIDALLPAKTEDDEPADDAAAQEVTTLSDEELAALEDERKGVDRERRKAERELAKLMEKLDVYTPVMVELPEDSRRTTHILKRGSFLNPGDEVTEDTPEVFAPFPDDLPRNRLGLAQWLTSTENPLTARVTVNRYWEQLFGAGIVPTVEEFGAQGAWPTHPELLDWLAVEFMEQDWSFKSLLRTLVLTSTYRQRSAVNPELLEVDPNNRWLARGPRFRLSAEQIRDQALMVSGLLSKKMYGKPVKPFQPEGVWQIVYNGDAWDQSEGEDRYRRGLYTFWRRTSPYPSMMAFDASSREVCAIQRIRTNTPLQALVTLNDPVYVEAAQAMARLVLDEAGDDLEAQLTLALERAVGRPAKEAEIDRLAQLYAEVLDTYSGDAENAELMATSYLGPVEDAPHDRLAALTVVCNTIMNLDEFLTKR